MCIRDRYWDEPVDSKEAKESTQKVNMFLCFCMGKWIRPTRTQGYNAAEEVVWDFLQNPDQERRYVNSWFDANNGSQMEELFPLWMAKNHSDSWRKCLQEVVQLYLSANDPTKGVEAGIVLSQTAMERLSYEEFVHDKKMLSKEGFGKIKSSDKLRMLFGHLRVPISIPTTTPELERLGAERNWIDVLEGLMQIRNSIVHPEYNKRDTFKKTKIEAWRCNLWLLELAILGILGYESTYASRMALNRWVGQIEDVPWK